jgi:hypothetical protein
MKFEIISDNPKIKEALEQICKHQPEFLRAGFITEWKKIKNKYFLIFKFSNPLAKAGMTNPISRKIMIGAMKKQLSNIDKNIKINYIKGD